VLLPASASLRNWRKEEDSSEEEGSGAGSREWGQKGLRNCICLLSTWQ